MVTFVFFCCLGLFHDPNRNETNQSQPQPAPVSGPGNDALAPEAAAASVSERFRLLTEQCQQIETLLEAEEKQMEPFVGLSSSQDAAKHAPCFQETDWRFIFR